jgi:hypothetical protein
VSIQDEFENFEAAMEGHETAYHFFEAGWNARGKTIETALGAAKVLSEGKQEPVVSEFIADLERSRAKHPGIKRMFDGLLGEAHELKRAYGGEGDIRAEAFDVAVCAYRIATEGDEGGNQKLEHVPDWMAWGSAPPPAAEMNAQLLDVLETVANNLGEFAGQMETQQKADQITAYASELFAAIAAAEAKMKEQAK